MPSVGSLEDKLMVTFAVGCEFNFIVNVAVPPASVVTKPLVGVTVTPATSLSRLVTETSDAFIPL